MDHILISREEQHSSIEQVVRTVLSVQKTDQIQDNRMLSFIYKEFPTVKILDQVLPPTFQTTSYLDFARTFEVGRARTSRYQGLGSGELSVALMISNHWSLWRLLAIGEPASSPYRLAPWKFINDLHYGSIRFCFLCFVHCKCQISSYKVSFDIMEHRKCGSRHHR